MVILRVTIAVVVGLLTTLVSTFVGERSAPATYPDIMGCEVTCEVVATGWPLIFVRDYLGMSVGKRADIMEVWFAADRFDTGPFIINVIVWAVVAYACMWAALNMAEQHRRTRSRR